MATDILAIKAYKDLYIQMQATTINIELYIAQREFVSVLVDPEKEIWLEQKIKAAQQYLTKIKKLWKKLEDIISENVYNSLSDVESVVFIEFFMKDLTAEQIISKYPSLTKQEIYNITSKIGKTLRGIPTTNWYPDQKKVLQK